MSAAGACPFTLSSLPEDLTWAVLRYVPKVEILVNLSLVSRDYLSLARNETFWFALSESLGLPDSLSLHQVHQATVHLEETRGYSSSSLYFSSSLSWSLLPSRDLVYAVWKRTHGWACLATSTDRHDEVVEHVLPSARDLRRGSFVPIGTAREGPYWCSDAAGTGEPKVADDALVLPTLCPTALLTTLAIKPHTEYDADIYADADADADANNDGEFNTPKVYSWHAVQIHVYWLPSSSSSSSPPPPSTTTTTTNQSPWNHPTKKKKTSAHNDNNDNNDDDNEKVQFHCGFPCYITGPSSPETNDNDIIQELFEGQEPHRCVYRSPVIPVTDRSDNGFQIYHFPPGTVGNVIRVVLMGKAIEQFPDEGYYVCVKRVMATGIPLFSCPEDRSKLPERFRFHWTQMIDDAPTKENFF